MKQNRDHPAFYKNASGHYEDGRMKGTYETQGLTKREFAAVHIISAMLVNDDRLIAGVEHYAYLAVRAADELFNELEQ